MFEYRQILVRIRSGDSDRALAKAGLIGRPKAKAHRDSHVQFEKCLYSVPFKLIGQSLWLKVTPITVRVYRDHELTAVHTRLFRTGSRTTLDDHLLPNAIVWKMRDPQWCLKQAQPAISWSSNCLPTRCWKTYARYKALSGSRINTPASDWRPPANGRWTTAIRVMAR